MAPLPPGPRMTATALSWAAEPLVRTPGGWDGRRALRRGYSWIPFGGGVRRCVGAAFALMELRLVLAELGRALDAAAPDAAPEHTRRRAITLVPERGAEVVLS